MGAAWRAIAQIHGDPSYLEPILQTALDGLRPPADGENPGREAGAARATERDAG